MSDETSGIIGWPIGQQYRERAALNEASTTTWETLVEQYRERAARDDARIEELMQRANHWHDVADMMKRQRDNAEENRDGWKIRAMKAEQERQTLRVELAKFSTFYDAERAMQSEQQLQSLRDLLTIADCSAFEGSGLLHCRHDAPCTVCSLRAERDALRKYAARWYEHITLKAAIDAALAVQPTTGDKHE